MKFCTNCGSEISENAKFCTNCGTRFEEKPAAVPEPVAMVPEQPVHEVFEQPAYEAPVQPAYEAPVQPVYEVPEQPAYQEPSQPVYQPQEGSFGDPVAEVSEEKRSDSGKKPANKRLLVIGAVAAVIAIIALVIGLVGGGSGADDPNLGIYNGTSCVVSGMELGAEGEWIELKAKGKATVFLMNEEYSAKWTLDGENLTIKQGGDEFTGTLSGGIMTVDFSGMEYTFVKEGVVVETEPPATEAAPAEIGLWKLRQMDSDDPANAVSAEDMQMLEDMLGMVGTLELREDGTGTLTLSGEEPEAMTWGEGKLTGSDGFSVDYTVADGILSFKVDDMTYIFVPMEEQAAPAETEPAGTEATEASTDEPTEAPTEAATQPTQAPAAGVIASADLGDFHVDIVGAEQFTDAEGKTAIRVYYDFYNNSNETTTSSSHFSFDVTQDEYELNYAYAKYGEDVPEYGNAYLNIRPGCAIRCTAEYSMKESGGNVIFRMYDFWDEEKALELEFDPRNLPGKPAESFVIATVADPQWTMELSDEGEYVDNTYVLIDSAEIVDGYDGGQLIRVILQFTNNSEESQSFWSVGGIYVYQDGIQLDMGTPATSTESDIAYTEDVAPGETVSVSMCFALRSESIVEVEVADLWSDMDLGCRFVLE